ncbi:MAG: ribonuclease HI [Holosporales bacterium]|jgi:ribonuclease HI|nr:ribonuclease HI [Holosporales bacterium]
MKTLDICDFFKEINAELPVDVYTDGACSGNPGPGGWGALLRQGDMCTELSGGESSTTNNRMELCAAIESLAKIPESFKINIVTDSQYLKNGIELWVKNWKKNGWKTASKQVVKNQDLWVRLDELCMARVVTWRWVKGHSGNEENEWVDSLAKQAIAQIIVNEAI